MQATTWREHNDNVCDSPNLYFAVLPNGNFAPCCDHRLGSNIPTYGANFPQVYRNQAFRDEVLKVTKPCSGCERARRALPAVSPATGVGRRPLGGPGRERL